MINNCKVLLSHVKSIVFQYFAGIQLAKYEWMKKNEIIVNKKV